MVGGGQNTMCQADFSWTVLDDQKELRDNLGIPEYQHDESFRFMTFLGAMVMFGILVSARDQPHTPTVKSYKLCIFPSLVTCTSKLVRRRKCHPKHHHRPRNVINRKISSR